MSPEKTKSLDLECKIGLPDNHQVRNNRQDHFLKNSESNACNGVSSKVEEEDSSEPVIQVHIRYPRTPEDSEKVASLKLVHIEHFFEPEEDEEIPTVEGESVCFSGKGNELIKLQQ